MKAIFFLFFFSPLIVGAEQDQSSLNPTSLFEGIKNQVRPYFVRVLGQEKTTQILGSVVEEIELPTIPLRDKNAASVSIYQQLYDENNPIAKIIPKKKRREFDLSYVYEVYKLVRGENPDDSELEKWLNVLDQGGTREGVYRAIILDDAYTRKEQFETPPGNPVIIFASYFFETYANKKIDIEQLEKANFYTLQRVLVDEALAIIASFEESNRSREIFSWYAVFSADIAQNYPDCWSKDLRKSISRRYYYDWAEGVPLQYLKSELILKTHKLMSCLGAA